MKIDFAKQTKTDKLILINPNDVDDEDLFMDVSIHSNRIENGVSIIPKLHKKTSLGAPLLASAKQALAFVKLIEEKQLSGIALEDFNDDIYRILGFRPHLYHHRFGELGCTIGFEADVPGILATIIASRLAGHIGMFNEFFSVDRYKNTIVMGHPGHGEISMGDPSTYMVTQEETFF